MSAAAPSVWTSRRPPVVRPPVPTAHPRGRGWAVTVARFCSLVHLFVVAALALVALAPSVISDWRPLSVVSGSMEPAVPRGAIVVIDPSPAVNPHAYPEIVAFRDASRGGALTTHRVVGTLASADGTVAYTTRGDANAVADSDPVRQEDVVGSVRLVVPFAGLPMTWWHTGNLRLLAAWVAVSLLSGVALLVRP